MTKYYFNNQIDEGYIKPKCFGQKVITAIRKHENYVGISLNYAVDENMVKKMVLVSVDQNENVSYHKLLAQKEFTCAPAFAANNNVLSA